MLASLGSFRVSVPQANHEILENIQKELKRLEEHFFPDEKAVIQIINHLISAFLQLCGWIQGTLECENGSERHLSAAKGQAVIASDLLSSPSISEFPNFHRAAEKAIASIKALNSLEDVAIVAKNIRSIPVPVFLAVKYSDRLNNGQNESDEVQIEELSKDPFVIKVMYTIDGKAWPNTLVVEAGIIYDIFASISISGWPENADYLIFDYVSTLDRALYNISILRIERPAENLLKEFKVKGQIEFPVGQSLLSDPVLIKVIGAFRSTKNSEISFPVTIVGYDQLRVRISDRTKVPILSRYKSIDSKILEIMNEIRQTIPKIDPGHLDDFLTALGAIANFMGVSLQEATYREGCVIHEKHFQRDLLRHMRLALGDEVKEAPKQGGGPTDIQYRTITIELKVEKNINDHTVLAKKYLAQPAQYSSAGGAQLGIVCILDLTEKNNPPANPQNNITLETPQLHGFEGREAQYPTKLAVVIIDGNLKLPSDYS